MQMVQDKTKNKPAQHFLPRFLLRGFALREGKKHYIFEFRNNGVIRRGEVGTVGYQRWFYGKDEHLDKTENRYSDLLHKLRTGSIDQAMHSNISEFVSHLLLRTNNFRQSMVQMGRSMKDGISELFDRVQPGSKFHDVIQQAANSTETRETIERELAKLPPAARPLYQSMIKELFDSTLMLEVLRTTVRKALPMVDILKVVRDAQIQVVLNEGRVQERANTLQGFTWRLLDYEPNTLVLGDHGLLGQERGKAVIRNPTLMENISELFLPISHQRLLVGDVDGCAEKPEPEFLNRNTVELSYEFFVARTDSLRERSYVPFIGKRASVFEPEELRRLIEQQLNSGPQDDQTPS